MEREALALDAQRESNVCTRPRPFLRNTWKRHEQPVAKGANACVCITGGLRGSIVSRTSLKRKKKREKEQNLAWTERSNSRANRSRRGNASWNIRQSSVPCRCDENLEHSRARSLSAPWKLWSRFLGSASRVLHDDESREGLSPIHYFIVQRAIE